MDNFKKSMENIIHNEEKTFTRTKVCICNFNLVYNTNWIWDILCRQTINTMKINF